MYIKKLIKNWLLKKVDLKPIPVEYKEQALEFQKVAGLLCLDIEVLNKCVNESTPKEDIIWQVRDLVKRKNEMISNKEVRDSRYAAASFLMNINNK